MSKKNLLLIVEGKNDLQLMNHLLKVYNFKEKYETYSYNTNIYELYDKLFNEEESDDFESLDLLQVLKSRENDVTKKLIFDRKYTDIILVFDFDPQDNRYTEEKIKILKSYFYESTENGKLYLNYPMYESFKHLKSFPDNEYKDRMVTRGILNKIPKSYKALVGEEAQITQISLFDRQKCNEVIMHNLKKTNYILNCNYNFQKEDEQEYYDYNFDIVLDKQTEMLAKSDSIYVLNTCCFYIMDYDAKLVLN